MSRTDPESSAVEPAGPPDPVTNAAADAAPDGDDGAASEEQTAGTGRGLRQLDADEFDALASVGGVRGLIETVLPGVVFVVLFVITRDLTTCLIASVGIAVVAVIARLVTRSPITPAVSGLLGVGIGAVWAWRTGEAADYYRWGLYVNLAWSVGVLVSILARWPVVGVVVSLLFNRGFGWRQDPVLRRRYALASWLWVAAFTLRLVVQVPLYLDSQVGWLGTARLVMGLPMWALVLWITWLLVRRREAPEDQEEPAADPS
ncbi:DUF3159 domain-containing protein [Ruania zhangjianzhongii]|uniref:DUF3159 domain-containing protein n=1 Tax=Ruania zhangjianzhongii TaxID=2603206 RepID=UPI0011C99300|nr:DUF3159 domain-containing protein [Ruania zhangjianzhongii]